MEAELTAHRAPADLLGRARVAAQDERRHTRTMVSLARRFGGHPVHPSLVRRPLRSLESIALENVVEGCVRETFGAAVALRQALSATDPEVKATHQAIAVEETSHAALSWDLHRWLRSTLPARARHELHRASRRAVEDLKREFSTSPAEALAEVAGLPCSEEATSMIAGLDAELFHDQLR